MRNFKMIAMSALLVAGCSICSADLTISTLGNKPVGTDDTGTTNAAQEFKTRTGTTTGTLQITLELLGSASGGAPVTLSLDSGNGRTPGSSLVDFGQITPTGTGYATYTESASYSLDANTDYWVEVTYLGNPSWAYTQTNGHTGSAKLGPFEISSDGGQSWGPAYDSSPYLFQVSDGAVAATPEPASLLLLIPFAGGVMYLRLRRSTAGVR